MKAMILGAGKGSRLHPITDQTPKPLVPLVGQRMLDLIINKLSSQGIKEIVVNTSHLGNQIDEVYQAGRQMGVELLCSYEGVVEGGELLPQPLGSAGAIRKVQQKWDYFDDTFVVVCGDAYFDFDIWEAIRSHYQRDALATVIVKEVEPEVLNKYGVVNFDDDCRVTSFQEKPSVHEALSRKVNTGIYIFSKEIIEMIPKEGACDIGSELLPMLVSKGLDFYIHETDRTWLDIGNLQDIHSSTRAVLNEETDIDIPGRRFSSSVWIAPSVIIRPETVVMRGPIFVDTGSEVESDAVIEGPTVVGRNCVVRSGARLTRTVVLGDHLEFSASCQLTDRIVTDEHVIDLDGNYCSLAQAGIIDARQISRHAERIEKINPSLKSKSAI